VVCLCGMWLCFVGGGGVEQVEFFIKGLCSVDRISLVSDFVL